MQRTFLENVSNQPLAPNRAALTVSQGSSIVHSRATLSNSSSSSTSNPRVLTSMSSFFEQAIEAGSKPGQNINDFMKGLENFVPAIPDAVTEYYMRTCGLPHSDPHVVRLIALATQKFMSDIIVDASERLNIQRGAASSSRHNSKVERRVLTNELLEPVLKARGIEIVRPPYYT